MRLTKVGEIPAGTTIVQVTPEVAYKWLEGNVANRDIRQSVVNRYARDMKAGRWMLTHQGIAFDASGTLIDGQHRLWAVVQSGVTVPMMVTRDVEANVRLVIDFGANRSAADSINLLGGVNGQRVTADDLAVLRRMLNGLSMHLPFTTPQLRELLPKYWEPIIFAKNSMGGRVKGVASAPVRAVLARAWFTANRDKLERFGKILVEGLCEDEVERSVIRLRDQMLTDWSVGAHGSTLIRYAKVERVLMAFLRGDSLSRIFPTERELFRVPGDEQFEAMRKEADREKTAKAAVKGQKALMKQHHHSEASAH